MLTCIMSSHIARKAIQYLQGVGQYKTTPDRAVHLLQGNIDDYSHPANSMIPAALLTRQGLPITLCIIHAGVGRRVGLDIQGKLSLNSK